MAEWSIAALRTILSTETDADSDLNEELMSQIRENIEAMIMLMFYTGDDGSCTSDPSPVTTIHDTDGVYAVNEYNGCVVVITSGTAKGNFYQIDATTAISLVCTGEDLYADGVRSGDTYKVFFDLKNTHGHAHDGIDSAVVELADNQVVLAKMADNSVDASNIVDASVGQAEVGPSAIGQGELKTSNGSVSTTNTAPYDHLTLPGGDYGFYPRIKGSDPTTNVWAIIASDYVVGVTYVTSIDMYTDVANTAYASQYYVTASGERHWVFILRDKSGKVLNEWEAPDHVCFGNGGKPKIVQHPFGSVKEKNGKYIKNINGEGDKEVELIVINPTMGQVERIIKNSYKDDDSIPDIGFLTSMNELYEINEIRTPAWNDEPVTVGLPMLDEKGNIAGDYRFHIGRKVCPVKKSIPRPTIMELAQFKRK